jgi:hypothetical protein
MMKLAPYAQPLAILTRPGQGAVAGSVARLLVERLRAWSLVGPAGQVELSLNSLNFELFALYLTIFN